MGCALALDSGLQEVDAPMAARILCVCFAGDVMVCVRVWSSCYSCLEYEHAHEVAEVLNSTLL
jgi:hypothetical protein